MDRHKKGFHFPTAIKWEYASKFQKDNVDAENYDKEDSHS